MKSVIGYPDFEFVAQLIYSKQLFKSSVPFVIAIRYHPKLLIRLAIICHSWLEQAPLTVSFNPLSHQHAR